MLIDSSGRNTWSWSDPHRGLMTGGHMTHCRARHRVTADYTQEVKNTSVPQLLLSSLKVKYSPNQICPVLVFSVSMMSPVKYWDLKQVETFGLSIKILSWRIESLSRACLIRPRSYCCFKDSYMNFDLRIWLYGWRTCLLVDLVAVCLCVPAKWHTDFQINQCFHLLM